MAKLDLYNTKRDFSKTTEPAGIVAKDSKVKRGDSRLRFVVQKHAASRLHYDFRLEIDGVLKSWAVTRGPSIDPTDKRLAVEVEDHPLDYGDFEGTIPAGEYGGGTVQLWDRGYWQPLQDGTPQQNLSKGELKFVLFGERLTGSWVLVRMHHDRNGGKRVNWLLIKHGDTQSKDPGKGQRAAAALLQLDESVASGRSLAEIAAGKGGKPTPFITKAKAATKKSEAKSVSAQKAKASKKQASAADKASNKNTLTNAKPVKHLPQFIEPALCKLVAQPPSSEHWLHEVKLDGYRLQLRVMGKQTQLRTRKGLDWTKKFAEVAARAAQLPDCIIDGELVALDAKGNPSFAELQAALAEHKTDALVFYAFDLLFLRQLDLRNCPLLERKQQLQLLLANHDSLNRIRYVDHILGDSNAIWSSACRLNLEGVISKQSQAVYRSGRSGDWVKAKCRAGHEVVIGGMTTDQSQLRSLLVGVMRKRQLVYVGRVGTGFSGKISKQVLPQLQALKTQQNPFQGDNAPGKASNVTWLEPQLVAEIEFAGWTGGDMLRQAAFKGLRQDKPAAEVQAETLAAGKPERIVTADTPPLKRQRKLQNKSANKSKHKSSTDATVAGIVISHPDKILWPATKDTPSTKIDLANYYITVSQWLLPQVIGRPCSIIRAPDGIAGEQFFQRHAMVGAAPTLKTIKLAGDHKPYLMIDSEAALVAVAQLAGMELHPGNGVPNSPEIPGRLVFDLDPAPDVDFKRVIKAALELRERLAQLGLNSFCKTTGGKGLHVVTPLLNAKTQRKRGDIDWPTAKLFAQTLCAQMVEDHPDLYLINMSKAARTGKIFLDYLRNDRLATAVAPLSPRARPGATVSMPLEWTQVRNGLEPQRFTIHTVTSLLKKTDPWQGYDAAAGSLASAAKLLLKQAAAHAA